MIYAFNGYLCLVIKFNNLQMKNFLLKSVRVLVLVLLMSVFGSLVNTAEASTCENCIWSGTHQVCDLSDVQQILGFVTEDCGTNTPMSCFGWEYGHCGDDL
ncbi:MAG: hypothetical protein ACJAS3_001491 [Roseivirga sp.]|jgi:hypothetical protein